MARKISIDPDIIGGKPRVKGTRVSVNQIYEMFEVRDMSAEEIAEVLPTVDESEVKKAIECVQESDN